MQGAGFASLIGRGWLQSGRAVLRRLLQGWQCGIFRILTSSTSGS
jgi:hypothetical protein